MVAAERLRRSLIAMTGSPQPAASRAFQARREPGSPNPGSHQKEEKKRNSRLLCTYGSIAQSKPLDVEPTQTLRETYGIPTLMAQGVWCAPVPSLCSLCIFLWRATVGQFRTHGDPNSSH